MSYDPQEAARRSHQQAMDDARRASQRSMEASRQASENARQTTQRNADAFNKMQQDQMLKRRRERTRGPASSSGNSVGGRIVAMFILLIFLAAFGLLAFMAYSAFYPR